MHNQPLINIHDDISHTPSNDCNDHDEAALAHLKATVGSFAGAVNTDARHATINDVGRDQHITYVNQSSESKEIFASLKPVDRGGYYVPPCMKGTREKIFEEIDHWLDNTYAPNVLWISGNPGAGKSTIASSLVSKLIERRRLGSSFFFKRGDVILSDPAAVWRTVAHDLAQCDTTFAENLMNNMERMTPHHGRPDIQLHFNVMVKEPLTISYRHSLSHTTPIIVIDALDECSSEGSQAVQRKFLLDTFAQWSHLSKKYKLIVTSRDERFIPERFRTICKQIVLPTGDGVDADTNGDIRLFFEEHFTALKGSLSHEWPWKRVIDVLTARAAGLFIWAETVVRFVEQGLPIERLDLILKGNLGDGDNLTKLYQQLLQLSFPKCNGRTLNVFRLVVGAIILAKGPIRCEDLFQLVLEPHSSIKFILDKLSSVILIEGTDKRLRLGHLSFSEFLCDRQRCPGDFFIDIGRESLGLAMSCFRLMKDELKFNICDLQSSHLLNDEVEDLPQRIETRISSALFYTCRFWVAHLRDTAIGREGHGALESEVEDFFNFRLLFWLEVLSLKKDVAAGNIALLTLASWIRVFNKKLAALAQDASRFIVTFEIPVSASTPHIYVSALPFAPPQCSIAKQYRSLFPKSLSVMSGGDQNWPAVLNIIRGHDKTVESVAFSPDGQMVASGSDDNTIRIWDAETGELTAGPFEGHTDNVYAIAYSPDSKQVASGSIDGTILIWSAGTGEVVAGPFKGHTDAVFSVAFSPDGKSVASGSKNGTILVWNTRTGDVVAGIFEGHANPIDSVSFSPDGKRVACSSYSRIFICDAGTGEVVAGPFECNADRVESVAFSPNGRRVASGSFDSTIRIWDAEVGVVVAGPFIGHTGRISLVVFSPDGERLVSGSDDCTIRIWDAETGEVVAGPFEGHAKAVSSVAISPDGKRVVSGSSDHTIRIWDAEAGEVVSRFEDQPKTLSCVRLTFSQDDQKTPCRSTVRVWDSSTNQLIAGPFTDVVCSFASAPEKPHIIAGIRSMALRISEVKTDQVLSSPFESLIGFLEFEKSGAGWVYCADLKGGDPNDFGLLFWVPETCREAICGAETVTVVGKRTTRLDLSRFVHGTSWTRCYFPPGADNLAVLDMHTSCVRHSAPDEIHSILPEANIASLSPSSGINSVTSDDSESLYIPYLQAVAFVLVPFFAGYYFRSISHK